jgi:hypothetical protein
MRSDDQIVCAARHPGPADTRGVYSYLILTEELGVFALWEVSENNCGVVRIVDLHRIGGHGTQVTTGLGH